MYIITVIMYKSRRIMPLQMQAVYSALCSALRAKCQTHRGTVHRFPLGYGRFSRTNQVPVESHRCFGRGLWGLAANSFLCGLRFSANNVYVFLIKQVRWFCNCCFLSYSIEIHC